MQAKRIIQFLAALAEHNEREWFKAHKDEYLACRDDFEAGVQQLIGRIGAFDPSVAHVVAHDCVYRPQRDIRFSTDKSPYKRHISAYICERGRKSIRGGYYLHMQPGQCLVAIGTPWLPTNILTACRQDIMGRPDEWRKTVESRKFLKYFGRPGSGNWNFEKLDEKGFGMMRLKTAPKGFDRDSDLIEYLRMKDYLVWQRVSDSFFEGDAWLDHTEDLCRTAQPMVAFVNEVVADYD